jgi:hypothetical protein
MGFIAVVGAFLIFLGFMSGSTSIVLLGGIIILLALVMFVLMAVLGMFGAAKEGVQTARQAKDLIDEVAPGAIPAAQRGVRRGLDIVAGRPPPQQQPYQQQPYQQQSYQQQSYQQQSYQQQSYQQQPYQQQPYQQPPPAPPEPPRAVNPMYYPCPTCGAGNPPGDAYCHYCKRPLQR